MNLAELVVAYNAVPTANRVARAKAALFMRTISAIVSLAIALVIAFTVGRDWSAPMLWGMFGVWIGVSVIWLVFSIVGLIKAKSDLRKVGNGPVLVLSREGIRLRDQQFSWTEVAAFKAVGSSVGAGPRLVIEPRQGEGAEIPLSFLDTLPGTIDSAARAYSAGRVGLDLSGLDAMF